MVSIEYPILSFLRHAKFAFISLTHLAQGNKSFGVGVGVATSFLLAREQARASQDTSETSRTLTKIFCSPKLCTSFACDE